MTETVSPNVPTPSDPRTAAGREYLRLLRWEAQHPDEHGDRRSDRDYIIAIEEEARDNEYDRIGLIAWAQPVITAEKARADLAKRIEAGVAAIEADTVDEYGLCRWCDEVGGHGGDCAIPQFRALVRREATR